MDGCAAAPQSIRDAKLSLAELWKLAEAPWPFGYAKGGYGQPLVDINATCRVLDGPLKSVGAYGLLAHHACMCAEGATTLARASLRHWVGLFVAQHSSEEEVVAHIRGLQLAHNRSLFAPLWRNRCNEAERDLLQSAMHGLATFEVAHATSEAHVWELAARLCNATHLASGGYAKAVYWECAHGIGHGVYHYVAATSASTPWPATRGGFRACLPPRPYGFPMAEDDRQRMDRVCAAAPTDELRFRCAEGGYHSYFKGRPPHGLSEIHVCTQRDGTIAAGCYLHQFSADGAPSLQPATICSSALLAPYGEANRVACVFGATGTVARYRGASYDADRCKLFGPRELACMRGAAFRAQQVRTYQVCSATLTQEGCTSLNANQTSRASSWTGNRH